jgi:cytochrome oxidase Cu insertion factor (SCO1/SenC/PrrC family)
MLGVLLAVWGDALREGVSGLWRTVAGRAAIGLAVVGVVAGMAAATVRVHDAVAEAPVLLGNGLPATRLGKAAPPLRLVDQSGAAVDLGQFGGRPVLLTFAYGHCETVCPLVVEDAVRAVAQAQDRAPVLLIVTLDPWRDIPSRLPYLAEQWRLPANAHVLGGEPKAVEAVLDAWQVTRSRDESTGVIVHAAPVYVIDGAGRIAYVAAGRTEDLVVLLRQL